MGPPPKPSSHRRSTSSWATSLGLRLTAAAFVALSITVCSLVLIHDRFPSVTSNNPKDMTRNCRIGADGRISCNSDSDEEDEDLGEDQRLDRFGARRSRTRAKTQAPIRKEHVAPAPPVDEFGEFKQDDSAPSELICFTVDGKQCPDDETNKGPPPELMGTKNLTKSDMILFKRASKVEPAFLQSTLDSLMEPAILGVKALANQVQAVKEENGRYNTPTMPRVAFLFLTRGPMPLAPLWEKFFDGFEELFTLYVHASPGFSPPSAEQDPIYSRLFTDNIIPSEQVKWGDVSMVDAERRLLAHALLNPSNMRFVLASETCMPLHGFSYFYSYLMGTNTSFLHSSCDSGWNCLGRYSPNMWPTIDRTQWKKGSQWWALTRDHAVIAVQDRTIYPVFARWCKGDDWHRHCYVDEFYFQTLLQVKDPKGVAERGPTWAAWGGEAHPLSYGAEDLTPAFLDDMKGKMCLWGNNHKESCFLLIRKVKPDAVKPLMSMFER